LSKEHRIEGEGYGQEDDLGKRTLKAGPEEYDASGHNALATVWRVSGHRCLHLRELLARNDPVYSTTAVIEHDEDMKIVRRALPAGDYSVEEHDDSVPVGGKYEEKQRCTSSAGHRTCR